MLITLATTIAGTADAQFWKKKSARHKHKHKKEQVMDESATAEDNEGPLSRKEEKKLKKERKRKEKLDRKKEKHDRRYNKRHALAMAANGSGTGMEIKRPADAYPLTRMKSRYRIDILAALYLDELVKGGEVTFANNKIPEKAAQGLAFYEGVLIAADSLKKAGFKIDIYVHDVASAKEAPAMLLAKGDLDSTDLMIGIVLPKDVPLLAAFAKKKQINFISTISPADGGIANNAYLTLMQPSLKSHCEWIGGNVAIQFPGMNVGLLYRTNTQLDATAYKYMTVDNMYHARYKELLCNTLPSKEKLRALFDTTKPNVVIMPVLDAAYADSLLKELSHDFPSTHFEVYGMPTWGKISNLKKESAFPNLSVDFTVPFHVDVTSAAGRYVTRTYKKDNVGKVPELVYRGYETMFWYANLLKQYGTIFNVKYEDNTAAPFTSFEMKPQMDRKGEILYYENKHVYLTRYEGGINKTE